ncbi:MAG: hypothetical protein ACT4OF_16055 [Caulobacteraceae bacterium]
MRTKRAKPGLKQMALTLLLCLSNTAWAQEASSIDDYVRTYAEARERGDLAAAESAVSAALAASEARDGNGGLTPALAFNVARTRVELGQWRTAYMPAQRAYELSREQGANSPVDPVRAQLLYGRVRLNIEGRYAVGFLRDALERAETREDLVSDRYEAADQFGLWAVEMHRYDLARRAWSIAANAAAGAPYDAAFARGRARAYEGIAVTLQSVTRDVYMRSTVVREARERFAEAHPLLQPYAMLDAADGSLTRPQEIYAHLLAWETAVWAKTTSDDWAMSRHGTLAANPTAVDQQPLCALQIDRGRLFYPTQPENEGQVGAVVVRLRFSPAGDHLTTDIAAAVGDENFARMVTQSLPEWTARMDSNGECFRPVVYFVQIAFAFRQ